MSVGDKEAEMMLRCSDSGSDSRTAHLVSVGPSSCGSATAESVGFRLVFQMDDRAREYERHVRSLPTLDTVLAKLRELHPSFNESLRVVLAQSRARMHGPTGRGAKLARSKRRPAGRRAS